MYNERNEPCNQFNPNLFVPGLALYVDLAEGFIRLVSRVAGFVTGLAYGRIRKP